MKHIWIEKDKKAPTLVLLHGTGGDEYSLLPLAEALLPNASVLSLRGNVNEDGMQRFFERYAEGDFNLESLAKETDELVLTLASLAKEYGLRQDKMILVGYSNGANIGAHLLLTKETPIQSGIFFHVMSLDDITEPKDLSQKHVWLSHGTMDPIVPADNFNTLTQHFKEARASLEVYEFYGGHGLTRDELEAAKGWLEKERM